jgi:hypothetical protein
LGRHQGLETWARHRMNRRLLFHPSIGGLHQGRAATGAWKAVR